MGGDEVTWIEMLYLSLIVWVSMRMLPEGAEPRHFILPLVFAGAGMVSMRQARESPSLSWVDALMAGSLYLGLVIKSESERKREE